MGYATCCSHMYCVVVNFYICYLNLILKKFTSELKNYELEKSDNGNGNNLACPLSCGI